MSSKKVFNINDKVFAKIRGYPAWPALVSGINKEKKKFNVYFYGTGERAECKAEELFPYIEYKSKLGKPNKRKYFAEALIEIENDLDGPTFVPDDDERVFLTSSNTEQESITSDGNISGIEKIGESFSESEGKLKINESTSSKGKLKINESTSSKGKLKIDDSNSSKEKLKVDKPGSSKGKNVTLSRKSLGLSISKGTKRKLSDVKPESSSKKMASQQVKELDEALLLITQPVVLMEAIPIPPSILERATLAKQNAETANRNVIADEHISETTDKQSKNLSTTESVLESNDTSLIESKTSKSVTKVKDSPTSSSEMSSSSNVGHVSRSGRKIKPKKFTDYENDSEVPKRSRLSKEITKSSEKQSTGIIESNNSLEQSSKTKDTSSETRKTSKSFETAAPPLKNDMIGKGINQVNDKISEEGDLPDELRGLLSDSLQRIETGWQKSYPHKANNVELLRTEVDLLDSVHKLRLALRTDRANYEVASELLEFISTLQINSLMLKKHQEVVETIKKVTKYVGNASEWGLTEEEVAKHYEEAMKVRRKAEKVFNKFISLFTVPDGQTFQEIFNQQVEDFYTKTKHLACDQIYGLTSDKQYK